MNDKLNNNISPELSMEEFGLWQELIHKRIGLYIKENRIDFLKRRLWTRMRTLSIQSYSGYYYFLLNENPRKNPGERKREWNELLELLVNGQSSFFRHSPSFDAITEHVLPEIVRQKRLEGLSTQQRAIVNQIAAKSPEHMPALQKHSVTIWSVGCSRGQEPYSLAMAFDRLFAETVDLDLTVTGTDISLNAICRAQTGEYSYFEIRDMPQIYKDRYMLPVNRVDSAKAQQQKFERYRVIDPIRKYVKFAVFNIKTFSDNGFEAMALNPIPMQDVIFCQNVLIYFNIHDRASIISMLLNHLRPGGYLFLAPGEGVNIKISGAVISRFKDTLSYKRNKEAVHVKVVQ